MNIIEAPPHPATPTTVTVDLTQLPELSAFDRIMLRLSLALIARIGRGAARERTRHAYGEWIARAQRERQAERLLLTTIPRR